MEGEKEASGGKGVKRGRTSSPSSSPKAATKVTTTSSGLGAATILLDDSRSGSRGDDGLPLEGMLRSQLTAEADVRVYEENIHKTMESFSDLRARRKDDFYRVFQLIKEKDNANERRRKVFDFFNRGIGRSNDFQAGEIYGISHELLVLVDEFRELLDRLFSWCDLCLPANEQAFAESHRQKIQKFQVQIVSEMKRSNSTRSAVNAHLATRVDTLRHMFSTKEVKVDNLEPWEKAHHELLTLQESNAYLSMCRSWEQILESYLLLLNYWSRNLKHDSIVFGDNGTGTGNDYFA